MVRSELGIRPTVTHWLVPTDPNDLQENNDIRSSDSGGIVNSLRHLISQNFKLLMLHFTQLHNFSHW